MNVKKMNRLTSMASVAAGVLALCVVAGKPLLEACGEALQTTICV